MVGKAKNDSVGTMYCYYLGKRYPLTAKVDATAKKITVQFDGQAFLAISPDVGEINFSKALKSFYVKSGRKYIDQRLKQYQPQIRIKYRSFKVESSNARWGSCDSDRKLTFNWRLMLLPQTVIDYVVVHELCHLKHMNHDRSFWRLVGKIYPDYKTAMAMIGSEKKRDL